MCIRKLMIEVEKKLQKIITFWRLNVLFSFMRASIDLKREVLSHIKHICDVSRLLPSYHQVLYISVSFPQKSSTFFSITKKNSNKYFFFASVFKRQFSCSTHVNFAATHNSVVEGQDQRETGRCSTKLFLVLTQSTFLNH